MSAPLSLLAAMPRAVVTLARRTLTNETCKYTAHAEKWARSEWRHHGKLRPRNRADCLGAWLTREHPPPPNFTLTLPARRFAAERIAPWAAHVDATNSFPKEVNLWREMGDMGLHGITVPEEFGGLGLGYLEHCVAMEELSRASGSVHVFYDGSVAEGHAALTAAGAIEPLAALGNFQVPSLRKLICG